MRPLLARQEAGQLLTFGTGGALNGAVSQIAYHGDNLVVGRLLGTQALGLYSRAFAVMMLPLGPVGSMLFAVLFPTLAKLRSEPRRFAQVYLTSVMLLTMAMAPVMAGMAVSAPHLVRGLYGDAWIGAVRPLQVFCFVGLFRIAASPAGAVTHAAGRVYAELWRQGVYAMWVVGGAVIGARWGITGVALGVASAILYKYVAIMSLTLRIIDAPWSRLLGAHAPGLWLAGFVGLVALVTRHTLEAAGAGSLLIVCVVAMVSAASLLVGMHFLPDRFRPPALFERLAHVAAPLPAPLREPLGWALRARA
jgi:PST family polysaccharide transporter